MDLDKLAAELLNNIDWEDDEIQWDQPQPLRHEKLNNEQQKIFDYIDKHIQNQKQENQESDRIKIFITGGAGTGKTFLLNTLCKHICGTFGNVLIKTAYTGMAASHISGQTLHSTFKLRQGIPSGSHEFKRLQDSFKFIKFLIIDEISMVSAEIFDEINTRLQVIFKSNELFGGINVILFGDLLQLPPIKGHQVYKSYLWRTFEFYELSHNMRQNGNTVFLNLLNNVRIGEVSSSDIQMMESKYSNNAHIFGDKFVIRVYPTNKLVQIYNDKILEYFIKKKEEIYEFEAVDKLTDFEPDETFDKLKDFKPKVIAKIQGIPQKIKLFRGARVMLRKNLCVRTNLVNGRIGTVVNCCLTDGKIEVQFDNDAKKFVFHYEIFIEFGVIRKALPFTLCFACTVHKLQGCTLDKAVIYLGSKHFQPGQIYVALSRVRNLKDFEIESFDESKFSKNKLINWSNLAELKRLRELYNNK